MKKHETLLILDFGSQFTQLIARRARELEIFSTILPGEVSMEKILAQDPHAVILSGGPASVHEVGAPRLAAGFWEWQAREKIPVLGICYGIQLMAADFGGKILSAEHREYGRTEVIPVAGSSKSPLNRKGSSSAFVWMSHGDKIETLPPGFVCTAKTAQGVPARIEWEERRLLGLQFHPEVTHTEGGTEILKEFLFDWAHFSKDWKMKGHLEEQIEFLRSRIGSEEQVLCALSGGVDSAVAATLVHRAIGDRLHCVFVDNGLLRLDEAQRVKNLFRDSLHLPVRFVDASERFLNRLQGISDPEEKRKRIGAEFIAVFEAECEKIADELGKKTGQSSGKRPEYLVQGTLYPDVIESSPPPGSVGELGGGRKHSAKIKSHHNVGGLPENMRFQLVEPLRHLFKDEVRALGKELGVPTAFLSRHPFPGPGLAVRVMGEVTKERLDILRLVDKIFIQELKNNNLYDKIWQAFAVFLPIKSVGVQGDGRTHDHVVALRAVTSADGMTADWYAFDHAFLAKISNRISNEVRGVNRVVYDISSKPPATIEWE